MNTPGSSSTPPGQPSGLEKFFRHAAASLRVNWGVGLLILGGLILEMLFNAAVPMSFKYLVDSAILPRNERVLFGILAGLSIGVVIVAGACLGRDFLYARFATRLLNELRLRIFAHLQKLSMDYFARSQVADILARFSTDLAAVEHALTAALSGGVLPALELTVSAVLLFALDWRLALVAMLVFPVGLIGPRLIIPRATVASYRRKEDEAKTMTFVQENVTAQSVIKAFGLEKPAVARFGERIAQLGATIMKVSFLGSLLERSAGIGTLAVQVAVMGAGAWMAFRGEMTIGSLVSFQALFVNFTYALTCMTQHFPMLVHAGAGMQRIEELLAERPRVVDVPEGPELPRLAGAITFDRVRFGYTPGQTILNEVSFTILAGQSVALVGPSGSGKSTALQLLTRFYDPDSGGVLLDGCDLRAGRLDSLREQLGVVFQDSILFNTTIRENIRIGKAGATDAEIEAAARAAEMHDLILALPEGYDTTVGERGGRLSGGQRQRIAIARAILRNPRILVLDEATSALDAATEAAINQTLERVAQGRTVVSVTHRLAAVAGMDRVFVLDHGRLVEQGPHDELLAQGGLYSRLWEKQHGFTFKDEGRQARVQSARLRLIPVMQSLDEPMLEAIADLLVTERHAADREIIHEGDPGDKFYLVARGKLSVSVATQSGGSETIRRLEDGDYFGEIALMKDTVRTATVRTSTECVLLTLGRDSFLRLLEKEPKLRRQFEKVVAERLETSQTAFFRK